MSLMRGNVDCTIYESQKCLITEEGRQGHKGRGKKETILAFWIYFKMWYIRILMTLMIEVLVVEQEMVGCVFYTIKMSGLSHG